MVWILGGINETWISTRGVVELGFTLTCSCSRCFDYDIQAKVNTRESNGRSTITRNENQIIIFESSELLNLCKRSCMITSRVMSHENSINAKRCVMLKNALQSQSKNVIARNEAAQNGRNGENGEKWRNNALRVVNVAEITTLRVQDIIHRDIWPQSLGRKHVIGGELSRAGRVCAAIDLV
jgi:hypothetical protein